MTVISYLSRVCNKLKFWPITGLFLLIILNFSACQSHYRIQNTSNLPTHLPPPDPEKLKLERKLLAEDIKVIQEGQYVLISVPSALLFLKRSPVVLWSSYQYLNDIACYIKMFRKVEVHVNAYDSFEDERQRSLSLTRLRATNVAKYLTSQGIDSRLLFMRGLSNDKPIMKTDRLENSLANSRIEILFKEEII